MESDEIRYAPSVVTSRKGIKYRNSDWRVHHFEVWSGELVARVAVLRVEGAVMVWVGDCGPPRLTELAMAVPSPSSRDALATALLGEEGPAASLARRLAKMLERQVHVCAGAVFDRFTVPLLEAGLVAEMKSHPECF